MLARELKLSINKQQYSNFSESLHAFAVNVPVTVNSLVCLSGESGKSERQDPQILL